jgi:hypothetical protein
MTIWKGYTLSDSNCLTSGKGKTVKMVWRPVVNGGDGGAGGGTETWMGRAWRIFMALRLFCMILWRMCVIIHLSKHRECVTPRGNPNANYGLLVAVMFPCRVMDWSKCITLIGDVDSRGGWRRRGNTGTLFFLLNFIVYLRLLYKIKFI